jgi:hypothetical protein
MRVSETMRMAPGKRLGKASGAVVGMGMIC